MEIDNEFKETQKQLLVDLTQELGSVVGRKKLMKRVAKNENNGNKINDIFIKSFRVSQDLFISLSFLITIKNFFSWFSNSETFWANGRRIEYQNKKYWID